MRFLWTSLACAVLLAATLVSHRAGEVPVSVPVGKCFTLPSNCSSATNELMCSDPRGDVIYQKGLIPEIQEKWQHRTSIKISGGLFSLYICNVTRQDIGTYYCECNSSFDKVQLTVEPKSEGTAKSSVATTTIAITTTNTTNTTTGDANKIPIVIGVPVAIVAIVVIVVIGVIIKRVKSRRQRVEGPSSSHESGTDEEKLEMNTTNTST